MPTRNSIFTPPAPIANIRTRDPKKLMTTTYGNEIAAVVNKSFAMPSSGQAGRFQTQQGFFDAQIVPKGPNDEDNLTGNWYWVQPICLRSPATTKELDADMIAEDLHIEQDLFVTGKSVIETDKARVIPAWAMTHNKTRLNSQGIVQVSVREVITATGSTHSYVILAPSISVSVPLRITGSKNGIMSYPVAVGRWKTDLTTTTGDIDSFCDFSAGDTGILLNQPNSTVNTFEIGVNEIVFGTYAFTDDTETSIFWTNYARALRAIRYNNTTHALEGSYRQADIGQLGNNDWFLIVQFDSCGGDNAGRTSMLAYTMALRRRN